MTPIAPGARAPSVARSDFCAETRFGFATHAGGRLDNQDYLGIAEGQPEQLAGRGMVLAVADGKSGSHEARMAAELTVRCFMETYYGLDERVSLEQAAAKALAVVNVWLHAHKGHDSSPRRMAATLTALILRGRQGFLLHVGDARVYRLRAGVLELLSKDQILPVGLGTVIARAVGLEEGLAADFRAVEVLPYDRFLLCTDGVHTAQTKKEMQAILLSYGDASEAAWQLVEHAMTRRDADSASAIVLDVLGLPPLKQAMLEQGLGRLPIRAAGNPGDMVDGFRLQSLIYHGRRSQLFTALDTLEKRQVVLKFPRPRMQSDEACYRGFIREAWISTRVRSPWVAEVIPLPEGRQTQLYTVMPFYDGETLEAKLIHNKIDLDEGIRIGSLLAKAIDALNRHGIIHRDVHPENVLLLKSGGLKLLDMELAKDGCPNPLLMDLAEIAGSLDAEGEPTAGTLSYMAPELIEGQIGDARSDVFAFGVTLYRTFSGGHFPYGIRKRAALGKYRPDLPPWLDAILEKATNANPKDRYADALELADELELAYLRGAWTCTRRRSLSERCPLRFWQSVSALLAVLLTIVSGWALLHH